MCCKIFCRSPHGERGLKSHLMLSFRREFESLSSRRAWIEITLVPIGSSLLNAVALLTESVD